MDWMAIFQQLGFPVGATIALAWCILKITIFFGEKIYLPLQEKHFLLVNKLESSLDTVNNAQMDLVLNMTKLVALLGRVDEKLTQFSDNQIKMAELIDKLSGNIDDLEQRLNKVEEKV